MSDTPNYNESTVTGTSWQRAAKVVIDNPYNKLPSITFVEEEVISVEDKIITEVVDNITCSFDSNSALHADIYIKLNELYILLRTARDAS